MSGEIAKTLRSKLWTLRLRPKDDVNKHINDFTLYMDQLRDLGREEREETLTDLFLDSVIDPKFEVTVANCRLRDHISIHECFEAVRKYDNVISREYIQGEGGGRQKFRRVNDNKRQPGKEKLDGSYRTYAEWQKLTPDQRANIIAAREKEKTGNKDAQEDEKEKETSTTEDGKGRHQRNRKRTRRQITNQDDRQDFGEDSNESGDIP
jgi:hypothetical protein